MNWEKVKELFRHNQFLALGLVIVLCLGLWLIGCDSKTVSPFNPAKKVTRVQLNNDVESIARDIELAYADLDKRDLFKEKVFEIGLAAAQGGTINPVGAGVTLLSILGIGAVADNRRKDAVIKTLQSKEKVA